LLGHVRLGLLPESSLEKSEPVSYRNRGRFPRVNFKRPNPFVSGANPVGLTHMVRRATHPIRGRLVPSCADRAILIPVCL